ncbi:MAG: hypothetical protein CBC13_10750 [Planctomycetia bacterium TMED53]|nr:MAG: hypothetical protein CBC13_10750 [Planctomycetia bacterium TMED53]
MNHEIDDDEPDLTEAELIFARLLAGNTSIDEAVERACKAHPALEPELLEQLANYIERRKERLGKPQKEKQESQSPEGLAGLILDRYSDQFSIDSEFDDPSGTPLIPDLGARYDLLEEIARGGMGAIMQILDPVLQRNLAMKVILGNSEGVAPSQRIRRFLREARITAQLPHPGIVSVHEMGCDDEGKYYFTMDKIEGKELRDVMIAHRDGDRYWDFNRLLETFLKVCDTLESAHDRGIVHRDIKPSNIMVGRFGETYVMDWGLARRTDDPGEDPIEDVIADHESFKHEGSTIVTRDGAVVGTPSYMSPEQASPEIGEIGPWTDVYALGSLLYEILTGHPPYRTPGGGPMPAHRILKKLKEGPPADVLELAPDTPSDLAEICRKTMDRDGSKRPASGGEVSKLIREVMRSRARDARATQEALEVAKRSRAVTRFLTNLFIQPGEENPSLHRIDAHELLDRGANQLVEGGPEQPEIQVTLLATMASVLLKTGNPDTAELLLEKEVGIRSEHCHWPGEDFILTLQKLSHAQIQLRKLTEAEKTLQKAIEQEVLSKEPELFTEVQWELAELLNLRGDWFQAEEIYRDLLLNLDKTNHSKMVEALLGLSRCYSYQGDWQEAEKVLQQAEVLCDGIGTAEHGELLFHMAGLELECDREEVSQERLLQAKEYLEEAIQIQIELSGERSSNTARYQRALSCCMQRLNDTDEAERIARVALIAIRQIHIVQHPLCARSFARLASILFKSGQKDTANKILREANVSLELGDGGIRAEHAFAAMEARVRLLSLAEQWEEAREALRQLDIKGDELPTMHAHRLQDIESICQDAGIVPQLRED